MKLVLTLLLLPLLFNSKSEEVEFTTSKQVVCGPQFYVVNNTSVTIQEIQVNGNIGLNCSFTNIQPNSLTSNCGGTVSDSHSVCIKVNTVPSGGGYLKVWNGTNLLDCMYISVGSNFMVCSIEEFQAFCGIIKIEFTTSSC